MESKYQIKPFYQGGYSTFSPSYGDVFTGYRTSVESLGITTNPQIATVAKEFSDKVNLGVKHVEVESLLPRVFDAMPKQQFKEINRLSKLTGVDVSFHGPLVEPSGVTQQGYSEANREAAEREMIEAIKRVYEANPNNMIINFHSSNQFPAPEITKEKIKLPSGEEKEIEKVERVIVVNTESGRVEGAIPIKPKAFPGEEIPQIEDEIKRLNEQGWNDRLTTLGYNLVRAKEYIGGVGLAKELVEKKDQIIGKINKKEELTEEEQNFVTFYNVGANFLNDSYRGFKDIFNRAYETGSEKDREKLDKFKEQIKGVVKEIDNDPESNESIKKRYNIIQNGLQVLKEIHPPQTLQELDKFMIDKTAKSFGNVAFESYKKFGETAPIIVIENPPANQQFARGEDLKNIVERAREKFVEDALKDGMSRKEAEEKAEKFIGASWDVGHINMLRKFGFSEKDILKETGKVAPLVKHVHLSDNFGFEHTELPMGMGNVPIKKIMEKLGEEGFEGKKIIEAGDWWTQHTPKGAGMPFTPSLEAMGSPIYYGGPGWNQYLGLQQGYFGGYGMMLPSINYETFGAGFSQLPAELGGQRQGAQGSRMSGRPME